MLRQFYITLTDKNTIVYYIICYVIFIVYIFLLVMRLGKKKEKDRELEKQWIDGIARLICSPKQSHPIPLRGTNGIFLIIMTVYLIY